MKIFVKFLFIVVAFGYTSSHDCRFRTHFKIDSALLNQKNLLSQNDTLILYHHWVYTNGENGYGKALLKSDENISITNFKLDSNRNLHSTEWQTHDKQSIVFEALTNCLAQKDTIFQRPMINHSHDGEHIIEVFTKDKLIYNFCIGDLWLYPNRFNNQVKLIYLLRDKQLTENMGVKINTYLIRKGRSKPIHNPALVESDSLIENFVYQYTQQRFLRPNIIYHWINNKWIVAK